MTSLNHMRLSARGFSLVELMVAMTLSLVLLAGALSILYSSKVTYAENDRIARLQEAGRTVVELILRDARAAGFQGCSRPGTLVTPAITNVLNNPTSLLWNLERPMLGYDGSTGGWTPALPAEITNPTADSDIIVLRTVREGTPSFQLRATPAGMNDPLTVARGQDVDLPVGSTLVINDCQGASIFAVSGFTAVNGTTATIEHAAANPGNASGSLGRVYQENARLTQLDSVIYYVRDSGTGLGPALWRKVGNAPEEELIEGVENLQFLYGVDTNADLLANRYDTAAQVDAANNWPNVISLTLAVLIRSENETNLEQDNRTYTMLTQIKGPFNDRRQRSLFITTVTLRNRTT
jgi:type IV pilus assembly protein PilW